MQKKLEVGNCKTSLDEHREYIYRYYLIESSKIVCINDNKVEVPSFGIGILREEFLDGKLIDSYEDNYDAVSPIKNKVISLIDYLIENEVSPLHLIDIIGENVDEWVSDFDMEARNQLNITVLA